MNAVTFYRNLESRAHFLDTRWPRTIFIKIDDTVFQDVDTKQLTGAEWLDVEDSLVEVFK